MPASLNTPIGRDFAYNGVEIRPDELSILEMRLSTAKVIVQKLTFLTIAELMAADYGDIAGNRPTAGEAKSVPAMQQALGCIADAVWANWSEPGDPELVLHGKIDWWAELTDLICFAGANELMELEVALTAWCDITMQAEHDAPYFLRGEPAPWDLGDIAPTAGQL